MWFRLAENASLAFGSQHCCSLKSIRHCFQLTAYSASQCFLSPISSVNSRCEHWPSPGLFLLFTGGVALCCISYILLHIPFYCSWMEKIALGYGPRDDRKVNTLKYWSKEECWLTKKPFFTLTVTPWKYSNFEAWSQIHWLTFDAWTSDSNFLKAPKCLNINLLILQVFPKGENEHGWVMKWHRLVS